MINRCTVTKVEINKGIKRKTGIDMGRGDWKAISLHNLGFFLICNFMFLILCQGNAPHPPSKKKEKQKKTKNKSPQLYIVKISS